MSREVKGTKQKQSMVGIYFVNAVVEKGGKILNEMLEGKRMLEYNLHDEMSITLETNGIDKNGNRFDPKTGKLLGVKGKTTISEKTKKEWEESHKSDKSVGTEIGD